MSPLGQLLRTAVIGQANDAVTCIFPVPSELFGHRTLEIREGAA